MLNLISRGELSQLAHMPEMAFQYPIIKVEEGAMSPYEKRAIKSLASSLVGIGIVDVSSVRKVGRVFSIDVVPHKKKDPTLVLCNEMDLSDYYELWRYHVQNENTWNGWDMERVEFSRQLFSAAISKAVKSARNLDRDEIIFAIIEMLQFQNEMLCR